MTQQRLEEIKGWADAPGVLLSHRGQTGIRELAAEVDRCWERITGLLNANNAEVERRRAVERRIETAERTVRYVQSEIDRLLEKLEMAESG